MLTSEKKEGKKGKKSCEMIEIYCSAYAIFSVGTVSERAAGVGRVCYFRA